MIPIKTIVSFGKLQKRGDNDTTGVVRIAIYLYISLCAAENITGHHDVNLKRLPYMTSLCPYNQFCKSSPSKIIRNETFESCCEKCSCKSDCHETGSCCFDAPSAGSTAPKYPCVHLSELTKQVPGLDISQNYVLRFHVITNCSENHQKRNYPKCNQPTNIEDYVIVSDPQTERVYRNKHCAECNDVHEYESWMVNIACLGQKNIFHMDSYEDIKRYWQSNCTLLSYPPNENAGSMSHCIPEIISECNTTGRWDTYDKELLGACNENRENQNAVFRSTDPFSFGESYVFYSSVYCYICNVPKSTVREDECKMIDLYTGSKSQGLIRIFGKVESENDEANTKGQDIPCKSFDVWDPFKKTCRQLICPKGKKASRGRCIGLLYKTVGLSFDLNFEIAFIDGQKPEVNLNLLSKIELMVFRKLGNDLKCGKCMSRLFNHMNFTDSVFLQLQIFTTESCTDDALLRRIRDLTGKEKINARMRTNQNVLKIELRLKFESFYLNQLFKSMIKMNYHLCSVPKRIDSTIFQQCTRILISKEEAGELGVDNTSLTRNKTDLDFLPICLDTYFSKYSLKSGASSSIVHGLSGWILYLQAVVRISIFVKGIIIM